MRQISFWPVLCLGPCCGANDDPQIPSRLKLFTLRPNIDVGVLFGACVVSSHLNSNLCAQVKSRAWRAVGIAEIRRWRLATNTITSTVSFAKVFASYGNVIAFDRLRRCWAWYGILHCFVIQSVTLFIHHAAVLKPHCRFCLFVRWMRLRNG